MVQIDVLETQSTFDEYKKQCSALVSKWGGEYVVRGGRQEMIEGEQVSSRTVLIKFPSYDRARDFELSEEYSQIKHLRIAATLPSGRITLVEGPPRLSPRLSPVLRPKPGPSAPEAAMQGAGI